MNRDDDYTMGWERPFPWPLFLILGTIIFVPIVLACIFLA